MSLFLPARITDIYLDLPARVTPSRGTDDSLQYARVFDQMETRSIDPRG